MAQDRKNSPRPSPGSIRKALVGKKSRVDMGRNNNEYIFYYMIFTVTKRMRATKTKEDTPLVVGKRKRHPHFE